MAVPSLHYVEPDPATGSSAAVVVRRDASLAHTSQPFPVDIGGRPVEVGDTEVQIDRVLEHLRLVLADAESEFSDLFKINVCITKIKRAEEVVREIAARPFLPARSDGQRGTSTRRARSRSN